jgi:hypothetical protein
MSPGAPANPDSYQNKSKPLKTDQIPLNLGLSPKKGVQRYEGKRELQMQDKKNFRGFGVEKGDWKV